MKSKISHKDLESDCSPFFISTKSNWQVQYFIEGKEISTKVFEKIITSTRSSELYPFLKSLIPAEKLLAEKRKEKLNQDKKYTIYTKDGIYYDASKAFYQKLLEEKLIHRANAAAVECIEGQFWFKEGLLHRLDGPACEYIDGSQHWYKEGLPHRTDGPSNVDEFGESWQIEGKLHRFNAPAAIHLNPRAESFEEWSIFGKKHREDGPAVKFTKEGTEYFSWYINDEEILQENFEKIIGSIKEEQLVTYLISPSPGERYLAEKQMIRIKGKQND